jgi:hypothetical protein
MEVDLKLYQGPFRQLLRLDKKYWRLFAPFLPYQYHIALTCDEEKNEENLPAQTIIARLGGLSPGHYFSPVH